MPTLHVGRIFDNLEPQLQSDLAGRLLAARKARTDAETLELLEQGEFELVAEPGGSAFRAFAGSLTAAYLATASRATGRLVPGQLWTFPATDPSVVADLGAQAARMELLAAEQVSTVAAIVAATAGPPTLATARRVRRALGLSPGQAESVSRFSRLLEESDPAVLRRDIAAGSDAAIEAIREGRTVSPAARERIVLADIERKVVRRVSGIALVEGQRAAHGSVSRAVALGLVAGVISGSSQVWGTKLDARVRSTHMTMEQQERSNGEPFTSGAGVPLRFPGDPDAPPEEIVECRCWLVFLTQRVREERAEQIRRNIERSFQ